MVQIRWHYKLVFLTIALAVLPALVIGIFSINATKDELKSSRNDELIYTADKLSEELDNVSVKLDQNYEFIKSGLNNESLDAKGKVNFLLTGIKNIDEIISVMLVYRNSPSSFSEVLEVHKEKLDDHTPLTNEAINTLYRSFQSDIVDMLDNNIKLSEPVYYKKSNQWISNYLSRVNGNQNEGLYFFAKINLKKIRDKIVNHPFNKVGSISVISIKKGSLFKTDSSGNVVDSSFVNEIKAMLKKTSRASGVLSYKNYKNENVVFCYSFPMHLNWAVVAEINNKKAYALVDHLFEVVGLWILAAIIIAAIGALMFSRNISKPIFSMANLAKSVSSGNFDVDKNYKVKDSIGELEDSLIHMSGSLKENFHKIEEQNKTLEDYSKNLEVKVEQRTEELKKANDELRVQYQNVWDLNNEKNEFLGIAAHDLKNPLVSIKGFGEIILDDPALPKETLTDFVKMIVDSSHRMFDIIKNLLDVNAIEQGKVKIELKQVALNMLLSGLIDIYKTAAEKKEIQLIAEIPDKQIIVMSDKNTLIQVFDNLLSNAIKFSPSNKNIFIRVTRLDDNILVGIRDEGPGFSDEDKKKVFGKFAKLSARPTAGENSTGLGLSIVKKLLEILGSKIELKSEFNKGAEFVVMFPIYTKCELPDDDEIFSI